MLDCLVTIKATMNVLQKSKDEIAESLVKDDTTTLLLQRFVKVIVDILKNGKTNVFRKFMTFHFPYPIRFQFQRIIFIANAFSLSTDTFFPDCRSAAGMAFALVVRTCAEKDALVQTVSNMMIHLPGGSKEYSA